jgi:hypothetical protein
MYQSLQMAGIRPSRFSAYQASEYRRGIYPYRVLKECFHIFQSETGILQ